MTIMSTAPRREHQNGVILTKALGFNMVFGGGPGKRAGQNGAFLSRSVELSTNLIVNVTKV